MKTKYFYFKEIQELLKEAGLPFTRLTLVKWEKQGKLKFRRRPCPTNPRYSRRVATTEDIEQIIDAFSPGGRGEWKFKK